MRTKKDIANTYRNYLIEQGKDKSVVDTFSDDELIEIIIEKCYDVSEIEGIKVSSVDAWFHFCNFIIHEDYLTGQKVWNKFVQDVFEIIEGNTQICFMASRGLGKSFITFVLYPLFKTFLFAHTDIIIVTNIPKMARRNLRVLKRIVDSNELLLEKKDMSNLRELKWGDKEVVYNEGFIETLSIGTTPRSAHVPLVILDDPLRDDNKYSNEHIFDFVRGQLLPCVKRLHGRLIVNGCVTGDTLITNKNGELMEIDSFGKGNINGQTPLNEYIYGLGGYHNASHYHINGFSKTIKIETNQGFILEGTPNHMIKVKKGEWKYKNHIWKRLDELTLKDEAIIQMPVGVFGKEEIDLEKAYLLGLYTAEGSIELKSHRITITNSEFKEICPKVGNWISKDNGLHNRLCSKELVDEFVTFGLKHETAHEKTIPSGLFKCSEKVIKNYLSGLFDGDGTVTDAVSLYSTSKKLLQQVQQLLLKFGVISSINLSSKAGRFSKKCGYSKYDCFQLNIYKESTDNFKKIGFRLKRKQDKLNQMNNGNLERVYENCFPSKIKSIEDSEANTYDFVIPETHSFNSNGFISHNTPQSTDDIFHRLMNMDPEGNGQIIKHGGISALGFYSKVFPAIVDMDAKEPYMPEVYTWDDLMEIKTIQGDILFTREYLCRVVSDDFAIFPEGMIRKCTKAGEFELESVGRPGATYVIGVDLASSASKTADYSSFCVIEYNTDKGIKILRNLINERMTAEEQERTLISLARRFNNAFVFVEKNNIGEYIRQKLENNNIYCEGFNTNKESKANAVKFLRSEMANRRIYFPEWESSTDVLKKQMINFGYKVVRGKKTMCALTGHDDAIDALWIANLATQQMDVMPSEAVLY